MSKELLKEHAYTKDDSLYCKHCDNEIRIEIEKFSYNHGYHTIYTTKHHCDCDGLKGISPIIIREED